MVELVVYEAVVVHGYKTAVYAKNEPAQGAEELERNKQRETGRKIESSGTTISKQIPGTGEPNRVQQSKERRKYGRAKQGKAKQGRANVSKDEKTIKKTKQNEKPKQANKRCRLTSERASEIRFTCLVRQAKPPKERGLCMPLGEGGDATKQGTFNKEIRNGF